MRCRLALLCAVLILACCLRGSAQKSGQALIDSLVSAARQLPQDSSGVLLMDAIAGLYSDIDPDEGMRWAVAELALAQKVRWRKGEGNAYNNIGNNYQSKGANPDALKAYFQALKIWEELGIREGIGVTSGNIGLVYRLQRDFGKAMTYCLSAVRIAEELGAENRLEAALGNVGNVLDDQGRYEAALAYKTRALAVAESLQDTAGIAMYLGNIGATYVMMQKYPEALAYAFRGLRLAERIGARQGVAGNTGNIGEAYVEIARAVPEPVSDNLVPEGRAANLEKGIDYLRRGIEASRSCGYTEAVVEFSRYLSEALTLRGDHQAALEVYQQYISLRDSIFNTENNQQIARLETRRQLELKEKQLEIDRLAVAKKRNERGFFIVGIGLLVAVILVVFRNYRVQRVLNGALSLEKDKVERRTEELDLTNRELNTTLTELKVTQQQLIIAEKQRENELIRSRISQDIHDDISSELTRISWVSELAKKKAAGAEYGAVPGLLDKLAASSRETVTKLGEIIWTVNPRNDSLGSLLAYMRGHITRFFADTAFHYRIDFPETGTEGRINPELKRNLYLVMKEALNNAVKYSGAQQIDISFGLNGNHYTLCIGDNGRGMQQGRVEGGGNGLGNMRRRMEAVQGSCTIHTKEGRGTSVCCEGVLF